MPFNDPAIWSLFGLFLAVYIGGFIMGRATMAGPRPPFDAEQFKARFINYSTAAIMFVLVVGVLIICVGCAILRHGADLYFIARLFGWR